MQDRLRLAILDINRQLQIDKFLDWIDLMEYFLSTLKCDTEVRLVVDKLNHLRDMFLYYGSNYMCSMMEKVGKPFMVKDDKAP